VLAGYATRACDPGWGNGWPAGPDAGPFGPVNHELHQPSAVRPQLPCGPTVCARPRANDARGPRGLTAGRTGKRRTGPKGQPFPQPGPSGRERPTERCIGPTGQQFLSMPAWFEERLARWAGRCVGGIRHQGLRPWLREWLARWAGRWPVRARKTRTTPTSGRATPTPGRPIQTPVGPNGQLAWASVDRPKGPAVPPARPIGPGQAPNEMFRPNGPTIPLVAHAVGGTIGPLGRIRIGPEVSRCHWGV